CAREGEEGDTAVTGDFW
nr:immunoglobulin heavy chain junction region [Macaca mulatta]MOV49806.1 immunoglobulin heavy chain junction region [Macaca mulatta]MOV51227.1 immunoglobulin heavy chain junction region [Macaca mulatta]MOV51532.1 immunoglobulin heavy chain junction region [Macaca mulatta]MOV53133.1 immunoglobulin heavy chain junction region [Macaca mulatta]